MRLAMLKLHFRSIEQNKSVFNTCSIMFILILLLSLHPHYALCCYFKWKIKHHHAFGIYDTTKWIIILYVKASESYYVLRWMRMKFYHDSNSVIAFRDITLTKHALALCVYVVFFFFHFPPMFSHLCWLVVSI